MNENEITNIVNQVLAIVRTNSKTIEQLTPVGVVEDDDRFEISGGRNVAYHDLAEQISSIQHDEIMEVVSSVNQERIAREAGDYSLHQEVVAENAGRTEADEALEDRIELLEGRPEFVRINAVTDYAVFQPQTLNKNSTDEGVELAWYGPGAYLFARKKGSDGVSWQNYQHWLDENRYNPPKANTVYFDVTDGAVYYWDGSDFKLVGKNYEGMLESFADDLNDIQADITGLQAAVNNDIAAAIASEASAREAEDSRISLALTQLQTAVNTLVSGNASAAIESFNEVISFLEGVTDDKKLSGLLLELRSEISVVESTLGASKADKSEVAASLALKADKSEVASTLATKADKTEVDTLTDQMGEMSTSMAEMQETVNGQIAEAIAGMQETIAEEGEARAAADTAMGGRIDALESAVGETGSSLSERIGAVEEAIAEGVGTVKSVSLNGTEVPADSEGNVNLRIDLPGEPDADLNPQSTNAVQGGVVARKIADIEASTLADAEVEVEEGNVHISLQNSVGGEITSFDIPAIGGGGGEVTEGKSVRLNVSVSSPTVKQGEGAQVRYTYDCVYVGGDNAGESTHEDAVITVEVIRGGLSVARISETKSPKTDTPYVTEIGRYLAPGNNDVKVTAEVYDTESGRTLRRSRTVKVYVSAMTLECDYSIGDMVQSAGVQGTLTIPYRISGAGNKTVYVYIDGSLANTASVSRSSVTNGEFRIDISGWERGTSHTMDMYAEVTIDGVLLRSELIHADLLAGDSETAWAGVMYSNPYDGTEITRNMQRTVDVTQYTPKEISYAAYDPAHPTATVRIYEDSVLKQTVQAQRKEMKYRITYTEREPQSHRILIGVGGAVSGTGTVALNVRVAASPIDISIATGQLAYSLDAKGRSNEESNPAVWRSNEGDDQESNLATFEGVDWSTSGWTGESLRLMNGAKATLDIQPWLSESNRTGMTLEMLVKVSNPADKNATVMDCSYLDGSTRKGLVMTASEIAYRTGANVSYLDEDGNTQEREMGLTTRYASDTGEYMLVAMVVTPLTGKSEAGIIELYVDGDRVGADTYASGYTFRLGSNGTSPKLTFDSTNANVEIKKVRLYKRGLSMDEELDNCIAEQPTADRMVEMHEINDVLEEGLDEDGMSKVSLQKLVNRGKGTLRFVMQDKFDTMFAGNDKSIKYYGDVYYTPSAAEAAAGVKPFYVLNATITIQGTSSTKYPAKNIRIVLNGSGARLFIDGVEVTGTKEYALHPTTPAQTRLCAKKDFVDSTMSLNTGGAKMFDNVMKRLGLLTPPQQWQKDHGQTITVRQAIDGVPVDVFVSETLDGEAEYVGQYNLNNEKSKSAKVFGMEGVEGFEPTCPIALESLNNGTDLCNFICTGDVDAKLESEFDGAFEFNSPEDYYWSAAKASSKGGTVATSEQKAAIRTLIAWIRECATNGGTRNPDPDNLTTYVSQKFKDEASQHFNVDHLLTYYLWTDYFMAVDQRAKNILWRTWDGLIWYATYYDGDTQMGKCNEGYLKYLYNVSRSSWDSEWGRHVFQGYQSWLWNLVLANFAEELRACAKRLRDVLTVQMVMNMYRDEQMGNWSLRQFNVSGYLSYVKPKIQPVYGHTWPYIYACQGRNLPHRQYMVQNRFAVLDAKYACGDFDSDVVPLSIAQNDGDSSYIRVTMSEDYCTGYGSNNTPHEYLSDVVPPGQMVELAIRGRRDGTDPMRLYGASRFTKLDFSRVGGHLSNKIEFGRCRLLQELDLSAPVGQASLAFSFDLNGCGLLRKVNLKGQTNACTGNLGSKTIDLSTQERLQQADMREVDAYSVVLAAGAPLTEIYMPDTIRTITLVNHAQLTTAGLHVTDYTTVRALTIQGCTRMDSKSVVSAWLAAKSAADHECSLTLGGINWSNVAVSTLLAMARLGTVDISGRIALATKPTQDEIAEMLTRLGSDIFEDGAKLRVTAPGGVVVVGPQNIPEGTEYTFKVVSLTEGQTLNLTAVANDPSSVTVTVDNVAKTIHIQSQVTGGVRSVAIKDGDTVIASIGISLLTFPSELSIEVVAGEGGILRPGQRVAVNVTPGSYDTYSGRWEVRYSRAADGVGAYVTIEDEGLDGCHLQLQGGDYSGTFDLTVSMFELGTSIRRWTRTLTLKVKGEHVAMLREENPEAFDWCKSKGWIERDDYMTFEECEAVTSFPNMQNSGIAHFEELYYFKNVVQFSDFYPWIDLTTMRNKFGLFRLPEGFFAITCKLFYTAYTDNKVCPHLAIDVPPTLTSFSGGAFGDRNGGSLIRYIYMRPLVPPRCTSESNKAVGGASNENKSYPQIMYIPAESESAYLATEWVQHLISSGWTISATL